MLTTRVLVQNVYATTMMSEFDMLRILNKLKTCAFNYDGIKQSFFLIRPLSVLQTAMLKDCIVPDVIDEAPVDLATIKYSSGVEVSCGNRLTPKDVCDCPSITWCSEVTNYYTVCMTDPDAPSRRNPKFREWHHWLLVNIPGNLVNLGETLSEYIGSAPPYGTGLHRYVFLVYKQPMKMAFDEERLSNKSSRNRAQFRIKKFAEKYKFGNPVAGNYFKAKYDPYVLFINKQLSDPCLQ
ncbi:hypothetical protein FQR65_LT02648 [Abscondita terminalis]|nr:hypothetical protein FQR65_LT02648 [Abscondita terminalis]